MRLWSSSQVIQIINASNRARIQREGELWKDVPEESEEREGFL
jgi:hypothetical protein